MGLFYSFAGAAHEYLQSTLQAGLFLQGSWQVDETVAAL